MRIVFSLRENGVIIYTKSVIVQEKIETGKYILVPCILGPLDLVGNPIISYDNKLYDVKISTAIIDSTRISEQVFGLNGTKPNCSR